MPELAAPRLAPSETLALVGVAGLATACALPADGVEDGPVLCPFRWVTGLPCPGCGLTRSWVYLAHGRWSEAWSAHPFGALTVLAVVALIGAVLLARGRGRTPPDLDRVLRRPVVVAVLVPLLSFAVVRLVLAVT